MSNYSLLSNEVKKIFDLEVRWFVGYVLNEYPGYLLVPSSRSGKNHPADEYRFGGNEVHLLRVLRVFEHLLRDDEGLEPHATHTKFTQHEKDVMRAALIIHDLNKVTKSGRSGTSPNMVAQLARKVYGRKWGQRVPWMDLLIELVAIHGGAFYEDAKVSKMTYKYYPDNKLHRTVHLADFIASRNDIRVDYRKQFDQRNKVSRLRAKWMRHVLKVLRGK